MARQPPYVLPIIIMYFFASVFSFVLVLDLVLGAEELGLLDKRIYKGYTMPSGQAPYAAHFMMTKGTNVEYLCGATFISPEYLVTAAHCLESGADPYKSSYVITIGYDSEDEGAQKQVKVINAYPHPKYIINASSEDARYDMAVLQVTAVSGANTARALIYTKDVNPGDTVLAVGWGGSEDAVTNKSLLRGANLIVGDSETCKKYMGAFTNSNDYMVCTLSGKTPGVGICGGDSGSSIMAKDGDVEKFIGISSRIVALGELNCGGDNTASFFTNVNLHMDFIIEKSGLTREYLTGEKPAPPPASDTKPPPPPPTTTPKPPPVPTTHHASTEPAPSSCENTNVLTVTEVIAITKTKTATSLPW